MFEMCFIFFLFLYCLSDVRNSFWLYVYKYKYVNPIEITSLTLQKYS